ncbi:MAG: protein adenylyltransferase SelO [Chitinophagales bacterium]
MKFHIDNRFIQELIADKSLENKSRQVLGAHFSFVSPRKPSSPRLIHYSKNVFEMLGLEEVDIHSKDFLDLVSGTAIYTKTKPYAMAYAGHQFGNWAGQLGDGRAINLFECLYNNNRFALQLKGAGRTPYSRTADGLAVLRSSIREHLCSEAMHHLGVPTTRSLSLVLTGDDVLRDMLYDGHPKYEPGAIVCRVAPSFIRFGNFEYFAAQKDIYGLRLLTDFTIRHFFPNIDKEDSKYLQFFEEVATRTMNMVHHWQRVGFVHGVMNTDNMSILGLTIDYGPYGFLDNYDPTWTPNTTDSQYRRYRYENQPQVALWNLLQLANALFPLIQDAEALEEILDHSYLLFKRNYQSMLAKKLGLNEKSDRCQKLIEDLSKNLEIVETDMTIFFRNLANVKKEQVASDAFKEVSEAFYELDQMPDELQGLWTEWFTDYLNALNLGDKSNLERQIEMNLVNPKYIFRNYMAQLAIEAAEKGDYSLISEMDSIFQNPYSEQPKHQKWFALRPKWADNKVGSSMLSCSS